MKDRPLMASNVEKADLLVLTQQFQRMYFRLQSDLNKLMVKTLIGGIKIAAWDPKVILQRDGRHIYQLANGLNWSPETGLYVSEFASDEIVDYVGKNFPDVAITFSEAHKAQWKKVLKKKKD